MFPGLTAYNSGKPPAEIELRRKSASTMTYEHVAMIPFMIDASHLTLEEAAERAANPALWAARRYGMPEHIFQIAAERHGAPLAKRGSPTKLVNYNAPSTTFCPATSHLDSRGAVPTQPKRPRDAQGQQSDLSRTTRTPTLGPSSAHSTDSPGTTSPSESYFTTILSPSASSDEMDVDSPSAAQRSAYSKHTGSKVRSNPSTEKFPRRRKGERTG